MTRRQQRFMYSELARKQAGQPTKTGMTLGELVEFAGSVVKKRKKTGRHK